MISSHFEIHYDAKEKKWYILDEEGNKYSTEKLDDIPNLIRKHLRNFYEELVFIYDTNSEI